MLARPDPPQSKGDLPQHIQLWTSGTRHHCHLPIIIDMMEVEIPAEPWEVSLEAWEKGAVEGETDEHR